MSDSVRAGPDAFARTRARRGGGGLVDVPEGEALTVGERLVGEFTLAASSYDAVTDEPGP